MDKVTPEQGEELLIAINMLVCGFTRMHLRQDVEKGRKQVEQATAKLKDLGVPFDFEY